MFYAAPRLVLSSNLDELFEENEELKNDLKLLTNKVQRCAPQLLVQDGQVEEVGEEEGEDTLLGDRLTSQPAAEVLTPTLSPDLEKSPPTNAGIGGEDLGDATPAGTSQVWFYVDYFNLGAPDIVFAWIILKV